MEPSTKEKALEKLMKFNVKIGYPDEWEDDYAQVSLDAKLPYVTNYLAAAKNRFARQLKDRMNKPTDRKKW